MKYAPTHHQALLQTLVQHNNHNNNEYTYHSIVIRHVAANKYIQKLWKQTIARDALLCYMISILFYITLKLQIHKVISMFIIIMMIVLHKGL